MSLRIAVAGVSLLALAVSACSRNNETPAATQDGAGEEHAAIDASVVTEAAAAWAALADPNERDAFTYANYRDIRVTNVDLDLTVDFEAKVLAGTAELDFERLSDSVNRIILDTNDLTIDLVEARVDDAWITTGYKLTPDDPQLGSSLAINFPDEADRVRINYKTSPGAGGLQWLSPEQTASGEHPFLFSQNQAIYARSMAPVQDTPAVRLTYSARIKTQPELVAVMSAEQDEGPRDGDYSFRMPQPIPSYLLAIAIGDLDFRPIGDHMGVYAESYIVDAATAEFEDTPLMEEAIEQFYGPYLWGRYDMIVLPPSFPFGGMENPRLSFLTPTLVAGDKSLTNVVAHELAHSWSGNLVTNATWRDAWLNEGFTVYVENRTMEALYGEDRAVMERALDLESLKRDVREAERPELTALKMPKDIANPDVPFSQVSYAGGMFFLKFLEERFGREVFDDFLRNYFDNFAFQAISTEDFLAYFAENLWAKNPGAVTKAEIDAWIYEPGLPDTIEAPQSDAFERVAMQQAAWLGGGDVEGIETGAWTTHEWLHFINTLPDDLGTEQMAALDGRFDLSNSQNAEIAFAWYMLAIKGGYEPAIEPLEEFLKRVGRGKFIYRLYQALVDNDRGEWGQSVYQVARPGYHPIAQARIDGIFGDAN